MIKVSIHSNKTAMSRASWDDVLWKANLQPFGILAKIIWSQFRHEKSLDKSM